MEGGSSKDSIQQSMLQMTKDLLGDDDFDENKDGMIIDGVTNFKTGNIPVYISKCMGDENDDELFVKYPILHDIKKAIQNENFLKYVALLALNNNGNDNKDDPIMVISDIIDDYKIKYAFNLFDFATYYEEFDTIKKSFLEKYGDESDNDNETLFFNMLDEKLKYTFDEQVLTKELKDIQPDIYQDIYNRALLLNNNNNSGGFIFNNDYYDDDSGNYQQSHITTRTEIKMVQVRMFTGEKEERRIKKKNRKNPSSSSKRRRHNI